MNMTEMLPLLPHALSMVGTIKALFVSETNTASDLF